MLFLLKIILDKNIILKLIKVLWVLKIVKNNKKRLKNRNLLLVIRILLRKCFLARMYRLKEMRSLLEILWSKTSCLGGGLVVYPELLLPIHHGRSMRDKCLLLNKRLFFQWQSTKKEKLPLQDKFLSKILVGLINKLIFLLNKLKVGLIQDLARSLSIKIQIIILHPQSRAHLIFNV